MPAAAWLESDEEFEGIGAHPLNPRYDPVDEEDPQPPPASVGRALQSVHSFLAGVTATRLDGHDGSHYQWSAGTNLDVLASATWIIWWKATQSTSYTDPSFLPVWARRKSFALSLAYHWLSSTTDPHQQASHYLQVLGNPDQHDGCMLDAEEGGITADGCLAWCETVEAVTQRPASVYTGLYVSGGSIWKSDALRMSKYGPRPFHVAAYVAEDNLRTRLHQIGGDNYPWHAWQFSSNGPVPGITGRADMNRVDDRAIYNTACGIGTIPLPIPTPTGDNNMSTAVFSLEGGGGHYMWTPGTVPIPFDNPEDRDVILQSMGVTYDPNNVRPISQEMFDRLVNSVPTGGGGGAAGPTKVTSTVQSVLS